MERESVKFVCEVNLEDMDGKWFKNSSRIKNGDDIKIRQEGKSFLLDLYHFWGLHSDWTESVGQFSMTAEQLQSTGLLWTHSFWYDIEGGTNLFHGCSTTLNVSING